MDWIWHFSNSCFADTLVFFLKNTLWTKNENNAIEFYKMAFEGNPANAVELYVGEKYIQHNPAVKNGTDGFSAYFEHMHNEYPIKSVEFIRTIAENDLVALHTH